MVSKPLESLLRDATIKAIDGISKRVTEAEKATEGAVSKLLKRWNKMENEEKEHVIGIVIATAGTAVAAIAALRARSKPERDAKKVAKKALKRLTGKS